MSKLAECALQVIQLLCFPHNVQLINRILENGCEERVQELRAPLPYLRKNILDIRVNRLQSRVDASDQLHLCHCLKLIQLALQGFLNWLFIALFSCYIVWDVQMIVGGKHQRANQFGPDDYIIAAIALYLDIVNLFLYLLELLRMLQGGDN